MSTYPDNLATAQADPGTVVTLEEDRAAGDGGLDVRSLRDLIAEVDAAPPPAYLIGGVLAEGDHGMFAAEVKAGKTWAVADVAVSVSSGTPWLGIFEVESRGPVLLFAGEGGARKLARRFRAVCAARGLDARALPIRVCLRVPHLTSAAAMSLVAAEIDRYRPRLVIVDPLYLAANGARGSDLYEMGANLERIQHVCQDAGAALLIVHHWNKTGMGKGSKRMSGAGPDAWGRVLISADVVSRNTDPVSRASDVVLDLDFQGDEIPETTVRIRRRVWVDDPDDLSSLMHYEVSRVEVKEAPTDPALTGLRPSALRVLKALEGPFATDPAGMDVRKVGDLVAVDGGDMPLKVRTIQAALKDLHDAGLAASAGTAGLWRSARAQTAEKEAESDH